jgi:hypothetical protein
MVFFLDVRKGAPYASERLAASMFSSIAELRKAWFSYELIAFLAV